jgi:hypothetical protein
MASGRQRKAGTSTCSEGQEHRRAGCGRDAHGRDHAALKGERTDDGQPLPASPRDLARGPLPAQGTAVSSGQAGIDPGLVEEDEPARVDPRQFGAPSRACLGHVLPFLLGRPERLFLRARPRLFGAWQT